MHTVILVPALLALSLSVAAKAAPVKTPATSKTQIDARGVAALDRSIEYYQKQRSFSVVATETQTLAKNPPKIAHYSLSLQAPYRASLKITRNSFGGAMQIPVATYLMDANNYYASYVEKPATTEKVAATKAARIQALEQMFANAPGVDFSVVALASGENGARDSQTKSVRYAQIHDNGRALINVVLTGQGPKNTPPIVAEFGLSPRTYAVEKIVLRSQTKAGNFVIVTRFADLRSNWKGSQAATDAAVYNWKKFAPNIKLESDRPKVAASVDARARAIFERATTLYGDLDGLHLEWTTTEFDPQFNDRAPHKAALDYDRAGRLRLEDPQSLDALMVIDGKTRSTVDTSDYDDEGNSKVTYQIEKLDADIVEGEVEFELSGQISPVIAIVRRFLDSNNPYAEAPTETITGKALLAYRAAILPAQPFDGQPCDLVRVTTRFDDDGTTVPGLTTKQETYWFARKDGRLMRVQVHSVEGNQQPRTSDSQIIEQTFDPKFAPDTFKFVPPKGAVLRK